MDTRGPTYLHSVEEQLRNLPLEDAPAFPVQLDRTLSHVNLQVDDPVRLRLELHDLVVAVDAEGERRRLAGTEGDQVAVQVAVFVLKIGKAFKNVHCLVPETTLSLWIANYF